MFLDQYPQNQLLRRSTRHNSQMQQMNLPQEMSPTNMEQAPLEEGMPN